jgi:hypothetical protein
MIGFIHNLLLKIPAPWRYVVELGAVLAVLLALFAFYGKVESWGYNRGSAKFHQEQEAWKVERTGILARAEASEKRAAELEPKAIAFEALAAQHKAADAGLVTKIEEVSKNAANAEAIAEGPADCADRAKRVCDGLRANKIAVDCGAITRESCGAR